MTDSDEELSSPNDLPSPAEPVTARNPQSTLPVEGARSFDEVVYHSADATYHAHYDPGLDSPSEAVVHAVSAVTDVPVDGLEPLYSAVDGDALNAVFELRPTDGEEGVSFVTFTYEGTSVTVDDGGTVEVRPTVE